MFILSDRFQILKFLLVQPFCLLHFHLLSYDRESPNDSSRSTDGVCLWLGLRLLLFGNRSNLIKITGKYCCIWYILGRFRQLEEDDSCTYDEETQNDCNDGCNCSLETSKKNCRRNNRGARKTNVIRGRYQGGVEDIQCFLSFHLC